MTGSSDQVEASVEPDRSGRAFGLELFRSYFVICETGTHYRIAERPAATATEAEAGKTGYVLKSQVYPWHTREALSFSPLSPAGERAEVLAWNDEASLVKFLENPDSSLSPPSFREDIGTLLKRERARRPYPVLSSKVHRLRGIVEKRIVEVLLPVAPPAEARIEIPVTETNKAVVIERLEQALTGTTFAIAHDATGHLDVFASRIATDIQAAFDQLPQEIVQATGIGFVFFRDEDEVEKREIVPARPVTEAVRTLKDTTTRHFYSGGGDPREPVLDAVYIAQNLFPWTDAGNGRRVIVTVIATDAKPHTTGKIDHMVPPGLDAGQIGASLAAAGIPAFSAQVGPADGGHLVRVLSTLATTTGGMFFGWGNDPNNVDRNQEIASALAGQMARTAADTFREGKAILARLEFDSRGVATLPLALLDGEKLDRLRNADILFKIDPGQGRVLLRTGFVVENSDLLEPQIQIGRKTLQYLIMVFSPFGIMHADFVFDIANQEIAAIVGEERVRHDIALTAKKQQGIQLGTPLLRGGVEYLPGIGPATRLAAYRRIRDAAKLLSQFEEANLDTFDKHRTVWLPLALLP